MVTSEQSGFCNSFSQYIVLNNHDICVIQYKENENKIFMETTDTYNTKGVLRNKDPLDPDPYKYHHCFLLGKGKGESVAREGALKIKEVSYIHAEGYSTSSLKHGPFALLEKDFPVLLCSFTNHFYEKDMNAYEEIKSRNAKIILISNKRKDDHNENEFLETRLERTRGLAADLHRNYRWHSFPAASVA